MYVLGFTKEKSIDNLRGLKMKGTTYIHNPRGYLLSLRTLQEYWTSLYSEIPMLEDSCTLVELDAPSGCVFDSKSGSYILSNNDCTSIAFKYRDKERSCIVDLKDIPNSAVLAVHRIDRLDKDIDRVTPMYINDDLGRAMINTTMYFNIHSEQVMKNGKQFISMSREDMAKFREWYGASSYSEDALFDQVMHTCNWSVTQRFRQIYTFERGNKPMHYVEENYL